MTAPQEETQTQKGRMVALVIAATMFLWLVAQWAGRYFDWPARFAFLFDMMAIAAFIWSLYVTYQIWRDRRHNQG